MKRDPPKEDMRLALLQLEHAIAETKRIALALYTLETSPALLTLRKMPRERGPAR
jgi:hypothetical protein